LTREAPHTLLYFLIAAMVVFWSANYSLGKVAMREIPPLLAGCLRISMAAAFILPIYAWSNRNSTWGNRDWPTLILLGGCGVTLNQVFFMLGLSRTSVAHSALIISMTPIFVLLIAAAIKQERITARKAAGMAIALGGVMVLNALPASGSGPSVLGDFLVFLGGLTFAVFTVFSKRVSARYSSVTMNTFAYVSGAMMLAPLTLWQARGFGFARVSAAAWLSLSFMALFPSVICYLIYYEALRFIPASRVAAFSYVQPALATVMAVIALGERVTWPLMAGGAVIFSGVYLTERG
jgi:drug/metabolite transporter (DMT)-like permease